MIKKIAFFLLIFFLADSNSYAANNICENLFIAKTKSGFFSTLIDSRGLSVVLVEPGRKPDITYLGGVIRRNVLHKKSFSVAPLKALYAQIYDRPSRVLTAKVLSKPMEPSRIVKSTATFFLASAMIMAGMHIYSSPEHLEEQALYITHHQVELLDKLNYDFRFQKIKTDYGHHKNALLATSEVFRFERQDKAYFDLLKHHKYDNKVFLRHHVFEHLKEVIDVGLIPSPELHVPANAQKPPSEAQIAQLFNLVHNYMAYDLAAQQYSEKYIPSILQTPFLNKLQSRYTNSVQIRYALQEYGYWCMKMKEAELLGGYYVGHHGQALKIEDMEAGILKN